jgi:hypothetical protein
VAIRTRPTASWNVKTGLFTTDETSTKCVTYKFQLVGLKRFLDAVVDCRIHVESEMLTSFYSKENRLVGQIHRRDLNEEGTPYCEHRLFIEK